MNTSPRDVFLRILSIISLYIVTVSFGILFFQYIDLLLPDQLDYYYFGAVASTVRGAMAALIIMFPVQLLLAIFFAREERIHPEFRESRLRKWLIYFTLFLASIIMLGDLVSLVYHFLEGDLTMRFILKIVAIFAITGTTFVYYLSLVREAWSPRRARLFAGIISLVFLLSVIFGFFTAGSPFLARQLRFDERRVNDLQMIQQEIINYWTQKDVLPDTLGALDDTISGFRAPVDPRTGDAYTYTVVDDVSFQLCAFFEQLQSRAPYAEARLSLKSYPFDSWDHAAGQTCFDRTIDPERYGFN